MAGHEYHRNTYLVLMIIISLFNSSFAGLSLTGFTDDPPVRITITGVLECTAPPDRPVRSPPIAGANVVYICGKDREGKDRASEDRAAVTDTVTTEDGLYKLDVFGDNLLSTLFDPAKQCRIIVRLPVLRCAAFPPKGSLVAVPQKLIGSAFIDELLGGGGGRVDYYEASQFQYYPPGHYY